MEEDALNLATRTYFLFWRFNAVDLESPCTNTITSHSVLGARQKIRFSRFGANGTLALYHKNINCLKSTNNRITDDGLQIEAWSILRRLCS